MDKYDFLGGYCLKVKGGWSVILTYSGGNICFVPTVFKKKKYAMDYINNENARQIQKEIMDLNRRK